MINFLRKSPAVFSIILLNLALFMLTLATEAPGLSLIEVLGLYYFDSPDFGLYQIPAHMFMHGGFVHLFFNMFALLLFGSQLETLWGWKRFLFFYLATGLGAVLLHQGVLAIEVYQIADSFTPGSDLGLPKGYVFVNSLDALNAKYFVPVIGASGSVFGLLLGYAVLFPNAKLIFLLLPVPVKAKFAMPVLMVIELFLGVQNYSFDNIAHFAHLGGALFGFLLVKLWSNNRTISSDNERL